MKRLQLKWYQHVTRSSELVKTILQGTAQGNRKRGRQRRRWENNITEWTGKALSDNLSRAEDRERWRERVADTVIPCGRLDQGICKM